MKTELLPRYGILVFVLLLAGAPAHAFPSLNLTAGTPNIGSSFINVNYSGGNAGGTLTASGVANVLTLNSNLNIAGGLFNLNANVNFNAQTANGTLTIGGTIAGLGFSSGTLLTGTFSSTAALQTFGAGPGDPLEFVFTVTGGDAASLYGGIGSTASVIVSQSGYAGSFASNFSSALNGALADTFQTIDTDGDGVPDFTDPDDDNDGIGDALDASPLVASNNCTTNDGTNATLVSAQVTDGQTCASKGSVDVNGDNGALNTVVFGIDPVVGTTGHLRLISEKVILSDAIVEAGGRMEVINADPCPGCLAP